MERFDIEKEPIRMQTYLETNKNKFETFDPKCRFCNKEYISFGMLWKHERLCARNENADMKRNSKDFDNQCELCKQSFRYASGLKKHMKRHTGEGGYTCKICSEKFATETERKIHKETAHNEIKCFLCNLVFEKNEELCKHVNCMHDGRDRIYSVCSDCGHQFRTNIQLKYHIDSKCGTIKQWSCNYCNSKFMTKYSLHAHELIHLGEKKHLCNYCGNSFLSKGQLKVHERRHTGEKPFACEVCGKSFAYRESLVTHSSVHTGVKPYLCLACGARFSCIGNLIKHRRKRLDTCGLPQYCNETVKVAPRPSAKCTKAKEAKNYSINDIKKNDDITSFKITEDEISTTDLKFENSSSNKTTNDNIDIKEEFNACVDMKRVKNNSETNCGNEINSIKINLNITSNKIKQEKDDLFLEDDNVNGKEQQKSVSGTTESIVKLDLSKEVGDDFRCNNNDYDSTSDFEAQSGNLSDDLKDFVPHLTNLTESKNHRSLYSCKFCLKEYTYLSALEKHEKSHADKVTKTMPVIKGNTDEENVKKKTVYSCKYCCKKYLLKSVLLKHEKEHGPDGSLKVKCSCCPLFFANTNLCLQHQSAEHKDKLTCIPCTKLFKRPELLIMHNSRSHSAKKKGKRKYEYVCSACGKVLPSKRILEEHEISHQNNGTVENQKTFATADHKHACIQCKRVYSSASSLRSHMTVHATGWQKLQHLCRYCGKAFRTRGEVKVHERGHSGERPYQCEFCAKAFAYRESLVTHRSIHTGFKRHACSVCGARFSCISNLQAHKRSRKNTCGSEKIDDTIISDKSKEHCTSNQNDTVNKQIFGSS